MMKFASNKVLFKELTPDEYFDPLALCPETPLTQAQFYGDWQKSLGREVKRFVAYDNEDVIAYLQLIRYPLIGDKNYWYAPYGPVIKIFSENLLTALRMMLARVFEKENAVFIRLDFTPPLEDESTQALLSKLFHTARPYTHHAAHFQPRREWLLELNKPEGELLGAMDKKTRYSIRLAEQKGVTGEIIEVNFEKYFDSFYRLMVETSSRNSFGLHPKEYYENIFKNLHAVQNSYLSVARYNDKILVVDVIIIFGTTATYVFGSSSTEYRDLMPSYVAQWKAITHAQKLGCLRYNFGGIATPDSAHKGWRGLSAFKKKFGGRLVRHSEFYDFVGHPFWYHLYNFRKLVKSFGI